jgi:hypothetical protein
MGIGTRPVSLEDALELVDGEVRSEIVEIRLQLINIGLIRAFRGDSIFQNINPSGNPRVAHLILHLLVPP